MPIAKTQMGTLKVLMIEDNDGDARLVVELLKEIKQTHFDTTRISDLNISSKIQRQKFDVILLDLHLPHSEPTATYKTVNRLFEATPIIVLTGLDDVILPLKLVSLGAQDYLLKNELDAVTLDRSIRYSIERKKSQLRSARALVRSRNLRIRAKGFQDETKRLEDLNDSKDLFLSIASHQLRTPATAVKQYLGMLLQGYFGDLPPAQRNVLQTAFESNERQIKIVNDLLKVAQLDNGQVVLNRKPTDIKKLLEEIIHEQANSLIERGQKISFLAPSQDLQALVDPDNIRMVVENIIDNASRYSPTNSEVEVRVVPKPLKINVEITDKGIGISKNDHDRLFAKFSRVGDAAKHVPDGSGLGLYWAKEIVKLHGGDIRLNSMLNEGSTFIIELPLPANKELN